MHVPRASMCAQQLVGPSLRRTTILFLDDALLRGHLRCLVVEGIGWDAGVTAANR